MEHLEFPDEVDTPLDQPALKRFARFRALQSFRASPWHPKENLPFEYSRIYQFANFALTQKEVLSDSKAAQKKQQQLKLSEKRLKRCGSDGKTIATTGTSGMGIGEEDDDDDDVSMGGATVATAAAEAFLVPGSTDTVQSGQYVEVVLAGDPADAGWCTTMLARMSTQSINAGFAVLPHENKLSVLHFNVTRCDDPTDMVSDAMTEAGTDVKAQEGRIIRSKDELIFHAGFRTFKARPVYRYLIMNPHLSYHS